MKTIIFLSLIGSSFAIRGINTGDMHNNADSDGTTNWRKPWP